MKLITPQLRDAHELYAVIDSNCGVKMPVKRQTVFDRLSQTGTSAANGRIHNNLYPSGNRVAPIKTSTLSLDQRRKSSSILPHRQTSNGTTLLHSGSKRPKTSMRDPPTFATMEHSDNANTCESLQQRGFIFPSMPQSYQTRAMAENFDFSKRGIECPPSGVVKDERTYHNRQSTAAALSAITTPLTEEERRERIWKWLEDCQELEFSDLEDDATETTSHNHSVVYSATLNKFIPQISKEMRRTNHEQFDSYRYSKELIL